MDANSLKDLIANHNNIVFLVEQVFQLNLIFQTLEVLLDYLAKNSINNLLLNNQFHILFCQISRRIFEFYKDKLIYPNAKPNNAHIALAKLEEMGKLKAVITQNIDGLHQMAGSKNVLELHGSVHRNYCTKCGKFLTQNLC